MALRGTMITILIVAGSLLLTVIESVPYSTDYLVGSMSESTEQRIHGWPLPLWIRTITHDHLGNTITTAIHPQRVNLLRSLSANVAISAFMFILIMWRRPKH